MYLIRMEKGGNVAEKLSLIRMEKGGNVAWVMSLIRKEEQGNDARNISPKGKEQSWNVAWVMPLIRKKKTGECCKEYLFASKMEKGGNVAWNTVTLTSSSLVVILGIRIKIIGMKGCSNTAWQRTRRDYSSSLVVILRMAEPIPGALSCLN